MSHSQSNLDQICVRRRLMEAKPFTTFSTNVEEDAFSLPLPKIDVGISVPHKAPIGESSASMNV